MMQYTVVTSQEELDGILRLQQANLADHLDADEIREQGFVTVSHSPQQLHRLHAIESSVIAKAEDRVVGYILAMTAASRDDIPVLVPMFELFDTLLHHDRPVNSYTYMLIGQVCVDKNYRGIGLFDHLYQTYINRFRHRYDFAITEIALNNRRSLRAHERVGFHTIHTYTSPDGVQWAIVVLDWKSL